MQAAGPDASEGSRGQTLFSGCAPILRALPTEQGALNVVTSALAPDPVRWDLDLFRIQSETGHALQLVTFVHFRRAVRGRPSPIEGVCGARVNSHAVSLRAFCRRWRSTRSCGAAS